MTKKQKKMLCRIIVTAVLVLAIRLFSIGGLPGTLLYLAAYLIIGYDILHKAGKGILRGQVFDENFLMAVATVGAIGLAFYEKSGDFMEAVAVMLFYQIEVDCANCANLMEEAAKKTEGVESAVVNFMTQKMIVEFREGTDPKTVMKAVLKNCKKVEDDCEIYL